jgi:hypothetical protein
VVSSNNDSFIKGGYILQPRLWDQSKAAGFPPIVRELWHYLLRNVNYTDNEICKRGEGYFNLETIQKDLSWMVGYRLMKYSKPQLTKSLRRLREANMIATPKATHGVFVSVINFNYYQNPDNYERNGEETTKATRRKWEGNANKKEKKEKEGKEEKKNTVGLIESIYQSYPKKVDKGHAIKAINAALEKVDANVLLESVKRYAAQWDGKDKKFCPNPATWFNGERWADEPEIKPNTNGKQQYEQRDANGLTRHERTDLQYQITAAVCREREERKRNGVSRPITGNEGQNLSGRIEPHLLGGASPPEG